ncbi:MAG: adenylate/guanylate cyclase domain-containing protein [bacterium]
MKRRRLLLGAAAGLAAAAAALALWLGGALDRLEQTTWAWRVQAMAGPGDATGRVKLILLDQASLDWAKAELQWGWPWPREAYGAILEFCRRGGARLVAFDVLFTEPSVYQVTDDEALGATLASGNDAVGAVFLGEASGENTRWPEGLPRGVQVSGIEEWARSADFADLRAARAAFPVPEIAARFLYLANVSDGPDPDGVFRRASLLRSFDGQAVLSLALGTLVADRLKHGEAVSAALRPGRLTVADRQVPIDRAGRAILRFRGPSQTHETYSAAAVLQSELRLREGSGSRPGIDPAVFRDGFVLFGFSAPGLMDLRPTPISRVYPGVEIHATALDNLLSGDFMRDADGTAVALGTLALALVAAVAMVLSRKTAHSLLAFAVFLPLPWAAGFGAYGAGLWWPVAAPEAGVLLALVSGVLINYATEGRQKAFYRNAFRHYLGQEVIEQILKDPSRLRLGGEKRELTIFFSDLEKFSSFSERLDPPALTALLNEYLTEMGAIIREEGGYLDKYIGDAIVAFWNAPLDQPDHAVRGLRAAVRCQRKLAELRPGFEARYGAVLRMRIGIHTGEVVVGNMGSADRFNYTILGDAANLASRLEGANKAFGTYTLASGSTRALAGEAFVGRELGRLRVVGRRQPVTVFEPAGLPGEGAAAAESERFEEGLRLCYEGAWKKAAACFESLPGDPPARAYAARCRGLLSAGDGGTWDGVWTLTEK